MTGVIRKKIYPRNIVEEYKISTITIRKFKAYFNTDDKHYTIRMTGRDVPVFLEQAIKYYNWDAIQARDFYNAFLDIVKLAQEAKKSIFVVYESDLYPNNNWDGNTGWDSLNNNLKDTKETNKQEKESQSKKTKKKTTKENKKE